MVDWTGSFGPSDAKIAVVGEAYGREEESRGRPFVGAAGQELARIFSDAGFDFEATFRTNLVNSRPGPAGNDFEQLLLPGRGTIGGLNPGPQLIEGIRTLYEQLDAVQPDVVVACGNYPLWALTSYADVVRGVDAPKNGSSPIPDSVSGIGKFHGSQLWRLASRLSGHDLAAMPVLPIYHPSGILRAWHFRPQTVHDLHLRLPKALSQSWAPSPRRYHAPPEYLALLQRLWTWADPTLGPRELAVDVENYRQVLTCIGLCDSYDEAWSIPFVRITDAKTFESYWTPKQEVTILKLLAKVLSAKHVSVVGQNLVYDFQWFWHLLRLVPRVSWDTMIAQHRMWLGTQKDLGYLSSIYCDHHIYWKDDNKEWATEGSLEQHLEYNGEDLVRTLEIAHRQREIMPHILGPKHGAFWQFELDKLDLALEMNRNGLATSTAVITENTRKILVQMANLEVKLRKLVPQSLIPTKSKVEWFRSDAQIKYVLYDLIGLPVQVDRGTKRPSTGKEALATLTEMFPRLTLLFKYLKDYGSLDTIYTTFCLAKREPATLRWHASFNPAATVTTRWSSSKNAFQRGGNMQNIPAGSSE